MSIHGILRHRARVERSTQTAGDDGYPVNTWSVVAEGLPCLLDVGKREYVPTYTKTQQETADRQGTLFTAPGSVVRPGDRLVGTRGFQGRFEVQADPAQVATLVTFSHSEWRVTEKPLT